jgi:osmotically-inducible protein OsmY
MIVAASVADEPVLVSCEENPLAISIRDAILAERRLGGANLRVDMHGKQVVLSGRVKTDDQRTLSLNIAGRYVGRDRVIDQLKMGEQIGSSV